MTTHINNKSIHVFELVINRNRSAHGQYLRIMDDIAPPWMKSSDENGH